MIVILLYAAADFCEFSRISLPWLPRNHGWSALVSWNDMYMKMKTVCPAVSPLFCTTLNPEHPRACFIAAPILPASGSTFVGDLFIQFTEIFKMFLWQYQSVSPGCWTQIQNSPEILNPHIPWPMVFPLLQFCKNAITICHFHHSLFSALYMHLLFYRVFYKKSSPEKYQLAGCPHAHYRLLCS